MIFHNLGHNNQCIASYLRHPIMPVIEYFSRGHPRLPDKRMDATPVKGEVCQYLKLQDQRLEVHKTTGIRQSRCAGAESLHEMAR
jgi:hypothetical protein